MWPLSAPARACSKGCSRGAQPKPPGSVHLLDGELKKEKEAIEIVVDILGQSHQDLKYQAVGLVVRGDIPHLGASPDGMLVCRCPACPR